MTSLNYENIEKGPTRSSTYLSCETIQTMSASLPETRSGPYSCCRRDREPAFNVSHLQKPLGSAQTYPFFPGARRILFLEGFQPFQDGLTSFLRTHPPQYSRHINLLHFLAQAKPQGPQQGHLQVMLCPWCRSGNLATLSGMTGTRGGSHRTLPKEPALALLGEHPVLRL